MSSRGKFIVIDGGDGAGKDTQIGLLKEALRGSDVVYPRDPGGTETSTAIRSLLLSPSMSGVLPRAELLLFLAARAQLVEESIRPALARGTHVVCNRFDLSTIAYQVYGRGREASLLEWGKAIRFGSADVVPDLYILLDVRPKTGMERTKSAKGADRDRFEMEELSFHERVNAGFRKHIVLYPSYLVVDANQDVSTVSREVIAAVRKVIES